MDAIYARQSVDKGDSLSIQGQIDLCRRETSDQVTIYQDKGFSGKNTNRPDFQRMIRDVEGGRIQKIVVYRLDRFSRSIADFGRLWEVLQANRVEFVSIHETFDTSTPMGRAMLNIIMVFAQLERETTAQRVRDSYYQRVGLGSWPGGPAPYGFSLGKLPSPGGGLVPGLLPNQNAPVVERIFHAYAQPEATLGSVARMLNGEHIPGPRRDTWDNVTLSRMLHNPVYAMADQEVFLYYAAKGLQMSGTPESFDGLHGAILTGKRNRSAGTYREGKEQHLAPSNHLGLIPAPLWLRCQAKLEDNRQLGGGGRGKHTWLSGLMKCGCCGYSIKVNREKERYYLLCSGRSNLRLCNQSIGVDLQALEGSVAQELEPLLAQCARQALPVEEDRATARALADIEEKIQRLMLALAEGTSLSMAYINRTIQTLEQQKTLLEVQRPQRPSPATRPLTFATLGFEEKKRVARQFIGEIRLSGEEAQVFWQI